MSSSHKIATDERARLEGRHPEVFHPTLWSRLPHLLLLAVMVGVAGYALWRLDFSLGRIATGLGHLARFFLLMFPPSTGGQFFAFLEALGETLAIAFLGTLIAAVLAFPFSFLAARNVLPNIFAHFAVRRVLDVIRGSTS